jgi:alanine-glyoxylate transaminase/serine-glyoxylate transaminase/serine-pyruvate transaminase
LYFPDGITASDLLPRLAAREVIVAGGLHSAIRGAFFDV